MTRAAGAPGTAAGGFRSAVPTDARFTAAQRELLARIEAACDECAGEPSSCLRARVKCCPDCTHTAEQFVAAHVAAEVQASKVPTNAELAERAKSATAHDVVRGWLARHVGLYAGYGHTEREKWLDWAALNFLADPEIGAHLHSEAEVQAATNQRAAEAAEVIDEAEDEAMERTDFMRGFVMGACVMAGQLGLPREIWAHPERARRRAAALAQSGEQEQGR